MTIASPLLVEEIHAARIPCRHCVLKHIGQARVLYCDWRNRQPKSYSRSQDMNEQILMLGRSRVLADECLKGYPQHYAFVIGLAACVEDGLLPDVVSVKDVLHYRTTVESVLRSERPMQVEWDMVDTSFHNACATLGVDVQYCLAVGHLGEAIDEGIDTPASSRQAVRDAFQLVLHCEKSQFVFSLLAHAAHQLTGGRATP